MLPELQDPVRLADRKCLDLVKEGIIKRGHATFHSTLHDFCCHAGVPHFECLGLGNPLSLPCLKYLWDFQNIVDPFIQAFVGLRSIATLHDLEREIVTMLNSFCVPPLEITAKEDTPKNPEEIALSDDDEAGDSAGQPAHLCSVCRYEDFGVGSLLAHPLVRIQFNCPPFATHIPPYSAADVLEELRRFASTSGSSRLDPGLFCEHLKTTFKVRHVDQLGMRPTTTEHALRKELQLVRHVESMQERLLRTKQQLWFQEHHAESEEVSKAVRKRKQHDLRRFNSEEVSLKPSNDSRVMRFVEHCSRAAHNRSSAVCKHAPTFTQLRDVVSDTLSKAVNSSHTPPPPSSNVHQQHPPPPHHHHQEEEARGQGKKRKRAKKNQAGGSEGGEVADWELVVNIVTEYAMLHLGSRKYRAKRWTMSGGDSDGEEAQGNGQEGEDEGFFSKEAEGQGEDRGALSNEEGGQGSGGEGSKGDTFQGKETAERGSEEGGGEEGGGRGDGDQREGAHECGGSMEDGVEDVDRSLAAVGGGVEATRVGGSYDGGDGSAAAGVDTCVDSNDVDEEKGEGLRKTGTDREEEESGADACVGADGSEIKAGDVDAGEETGRDDGGGKAPGGGGRGKPLDNGLRVTVEDHRRPAPRLRFEAARRFAGKRVTVSDEDLVTCLPWPLPATWAGISQPLDPDVGQGEGAVERRVGRMGEALVYQLLLQECGGTCAVEWCNQEEESRAYYDIKVTPRGEEVGGVATERLAAAVFVEVKTTRWAANNVFELSLPELQFACRDGVRYDIYRVYLPPQWSAPQQGPAPHWQDAGPGVRVTVVKDVASALRERRVQLCMAV